MYTVDSASISEILSFRDEPVPFTGREKSEIKPADLDAFTSLRSVYAPGDTVGVGVAAPVRVTVAERVCVTVGDAVTVAGAEFVVVRVSVPVGDGERDGVTPIVMVDVGVGVNVDVTDGVCVSELVGVSVPVGVSVLETEGELVGDGVDVGVGGGSLNEMDHLKEHGACMSPSARVHDAQAQHVDDVHGYTATKESAIAKPGVYVFVSDSKVVVDESDVGSCHAVPRSFGPTPYGAG